jgi:hypothetical protein
MGNSQSVPEANSPPWFVHGLEYPPFVVVEQRDGYQIRKYKSSKWVGVKTETDSCGDASYKSFFKLFKFISGENAASLKIPMTAPVSVKIPNETNANGKKHFITHFYLPLEFQSWSSDGKAPPAPNNPEVDFYEYPEFTVYVFEYGGYSNDSKLQQHSRELAEMLKRDGLEYNDEYSFYAGYDPPFRLFNRHNEIWFVAKETVANEISLEASEEPTNNN